MSALFDETVELAIEPLPKGRPRATVLPSRDQRKGRPCPHCGRRIHVLIHPDDRSDRYEREVAMAVGRTLGDRLRPIGRRDSPPLAVDVLAVTSRPQRLWRRKDPEGLIWAPVAPDIDNLAKAALDALQRCSWCGRTQGRGKHHCRCAGPVLIGDDARVVALSARHAYAELVDRRSGPARLRVRVREIGGWLDEPTDTGTLQQALL